jgi:uncharacterized protein YbaP (TraB family)
MFSKKRFKKILQLSFLISGIFGLGCKTPKTIDRFAALKPIENSDADSITLTNSLLWEISGNGLTQKSYLYGTIHMIAKTDFFITTPTQLALESSDKVVFEINLRKMKNPMAMLSIFSKAMMKDGKRLRDLISPEDYALVKRKFEAIGLPLTMLERVKPLFLASFADGDGMPNRESSTSYEMEFLEIAEKNNKSLDGLETVEFQMGIFDSIPYRAQAEMLVANLKSDKKDDNEFKKMVNLYKSQDIEALCKTIQADTTTVKGEGLGSYEDMLLVNRNRNWIPIMGRMMREKKTFFAVGAGHLAGTNGVIRLLRREGYKVRAVK